MIQLEESPEYSSSKLRRGSADIESLGEGNYGGLPYALRSVSTDVVRREVPSMNMELLTRKQLDYMVPEMPKGTNSPLVFVVGEYAVHGLLGKGGSGSVFLGSHVTTGKLVAIKMVDKKRDSAGNSEGMSEFKILKALQHKHVVPLLHAEENDNRICMVLAYAQNGDLWAHIKKQRAQRETQKTSRSLKKQRVKAVEQPHYDEETAKRLFKQLLNAVHYIHLKGYAHRDIKPENVLIDEDENVMLCDFSLATTWSPSIRRKGSCGTLHFAAPEVLMEVGYVGPEVDIWSCGAVLYFILSGEKPFQAADDFGVVMNVKKGKRKPLDKKRVSRAARNLVDRMLEPNPLKRITMMDILNHDWFAASPIPKDLPSSPVRKKRSGSVARLENQVSRSGELVTRARSRSTDDYLLPSCSTSSVRSRFAQSPLLTIQE